MKITSANRVPREPLGPRYPRRPLACGEHVVSVVFPYRIHVRGADAEEASVERQRYFGRGHVRPFPILSSDARA